MQKIRKAGLEIMDNKGSDFLKDFFWNLLVYVLVMVYCFVMLLLFHMIFHVMLGLDWTIAGIRNAALIMATVYMVVKIVCNMLKK